MTLTAVIAHGHGCFMYLSSEALTEGSNWNWECAPGMHLFYRIKCLGKILPCLNTLKHFGAFPLIPFSPLSFVR
jgi:hypothetical protein